MGFLGATPLSLRSKRRDEMRLFCVKIYISNKMQLMELGFCEVLNEIHLSDFLYLPFGACQKLYL